jgi:hypothetical protein
MNATPTATTRKALLAAGLVGMLCAGPAHAARLYPVVTVVDQRLVLDLDTVRYDASGGLLMGDAYWCGSSGACAPWRYVVLAENCPTGHGNMLVRTLPTGVPLFPDWHGNGHEPTDLIALDLCVVYAAGGAKAGL